MDIFSAVGNTPLFELKSFGDEKRGIHILAKGEFLNISGSVKDRAAKAMILDGIERGLLTKDKISSLSSLHFCFCLSAFSIALNPSDMTVLPFAVKEKPLHPISAVTVS